MTVVLMSICHFVRPTLVCPYEAVFKPFSEIIKSDDLKLYDALHYILSEFRNCWTPTSSLTLSFYKKSSMGMKLSRMV